MERKIVQIVANEMDVETGLWRLLGLGSDGVVYAATDSGTGWEVFRPALAPVSPRQPEKEVGHWQEIGDLRKENEALRDHAEKFAVLAKHWLDICVATGASHMPGEALHDTMLRWVREQRARDIACEAWMRDACAWIENVVGWARDGYQTMPGVFAGARALVERCPARPKKGGAG